MGPGGVGVTVAGARGARDLPAAQDRLGGPPGWVETDSDSRRHYGPEAA